MHAPYPSINVNPEDTDAKRNGVLGVGNDRLDQSIVKNLKSTVFSKAGAGEL